jgi:catechol 2,3-dioxygenase-like lactoylglutathione lyase family enzyme
MVPARELRFSFVIDDYEAAAHLYGDVFGLEVLMDLDEQGGRGVILKVPEATLELVDAEHGGMVDDVEVGRRIGDRVRIAVKVDDLGGQPGRGRYRERAYGSPGRFPLGRQEPAVQGQGRHAAHAVPVALIVNAATKAAVPPDRSLRSDSGE